MSEDPLKLLLQGYNAVDLYDIFKENGIDKNSFRQLTEKDLLSIGIDDKKLIENITKHNKHRNLPTKFYYSPFNGKYLMNILKETQKQVLRLTYTILCTVTNLQKSKNPTDMLLLNNVFASQASAEGIKCLYTSLNNFEKQLLEMEKELLDLKDKNLIIEKHN